MLRSTSPVLVPRLTGAASVVELPRRPRLPPGPVKDILFSAFRELLGTNGTGKAAGRKGEAIGDRGVGLAEAATASDPVVLRLKDIQPNRSVF